MSFSISDLGNVTPSEPVDLSTIAPPRKSRFPRAGIYTLRMPDVIDPAFTFSTTQAGYLSAEVNPTIVGGDHDGYEVRFQKVSAKTFPETDKKTGEVRKTSQMARLLAALGVTGTLSDQQMADAILASGGKEFRAVLDWRAFNKRTREEVEGEANFPLSAAGNPLPWIEDAEDLVESTKEPGTMIPKRYSARIYIKRYLTR